MHVPLLFSFWFTVAAYVVHCIDESLLGGSFVEKVRQHWWPQYSWTKFFWFNSAYFVVMIASVILYDFRDGAWMILGPVVRRPAQKDVAAIPELWFSWPSIDGLPELDA
jgi:hypothetical protein